MEGKLGRKDGKKSFPKKAGADLRRRGGTRKRGRGGRGGKKKKQRPAQGKGRKKRTEKEVPASGKDVDEGWVRE